jgi:hypothetical protein
LQQAAGADPDLGGIVAATAGLAPNRKALERCCQRLARLRGVVRAALSGEEVVLVLRNRREVVTRAEATDLFAETALIYTRLSIRPARGGTAYRLMRASFCLHALERLVERSRLPLDRPLLPALDAEAVRMLVRLSKGQGIEDEGDTFIPALVPGVWAGSLDRSALEEDWGLIFDSPQAVVPVCSVRTFLSPEEMRPTVWLKWKDDPAHRTRG